MTAGSLFTPSFQQVYLIAGAVGGVGGGLSAFPARLPAFAVTPSEIWLIFPLRLLLGKSIHPGAVQVSGKDAAGYGADYPVSSVMSMTLCSRRWYLLLSVRPAPW